MKIELALVISAASFILAVIVGVSGLKRNNKQDTSSSAMMMGQIMEKIDNNSKEQKELRADVKAIRDGVDAVQKDVVELQVRLKLVEDKVYKKEGDTK